MRTVVAIAFAGLAAAPALGVFQVRSVDCTAPNSPMLVAPNLFQSTAPGAGNTAPSEDSIEASAANQWLEYGSYVGIDTGPATPGTIGLPYDGFSCNPGDLSLLGSPFAVPGQINGLWFMDPNGTRPLVEAAPNSLFGGQPAVFLGRFSFRTTDGSAPSGTLSLGPNGLTVEAVVQTVSIESAVEPVFVHFSAFDAPVVTGIPTNGSNPTGFYPPLMLTQHVFQAGPRPGGTARWEVHDLYIVEVPGPGTAVIGGLALIRPLRRRR